MNVIVQINLKLMDNFLKIYTHSVRIGMVSILFFVFCKNVIQAPLEDIIL